MVRPVASTSKPLVFLIFLVFIYLYPGLSEECTALSFAPIFHLVKPMNEEPSTLYAKLLGETASITWAELQPFFARGALLWVEPALDLIEVAQAVAENRADKVSAWLASGEVGKVAESRALELVERDPVLWAVVVAPWVLVQDRAPSL